MQSEGWEGLRTLSYGQNVPDVWRAFEEGAHGAPAGVVALVDREPGGGLEYPASGRGDERLQTLHTAVYSVLRRHTHGHTTFDIGYRYRSPVLGPPVLH